jgi:hypothetical protein
MEWLLFLARRLQDMPVTLVLSARPASAGGWPEPLKLLSGQGGVAVMRPRPLSERASTILVRRMFGAPPRRRSASPATKRAAATRSSWVS